MTLKTTAALFAFLTVCSGTGSLAKDLDCSTIWSAVESTVESAGLQMAPWHPKAEVGKSGNCIVSHFGIDVIPGLRVVSKKLEWSGSDFTVFVEEGMPPKNLIITLSGATIEVRPTGDRQGQALFAMSGARKRPPVSMQLHLSHGGGHVRLTSAEGDSAADPSIWLDADITGLDLTSRENARSSIPNLLLTRAESELFLSRNLETIVHYAIASPGVQGDNPQSAFADAKRGIDDWIDSLPGNLVSLNSRSALKSTMGGWPSLRGRLVTNIETPKGINLVELVGFLARGELDDSKAIERVFHGTQITFRHHR